MICRRKIEVCKDNPGPPQTLVSRHTLTDYFQVNQLLDRARAQADNLLANANEERNAMLEREAFKIWQRVEAQFKRWESDRQKMCDNLEQYATSVVNQAIHKLLDDTIEPKRLAALVKHLVAFQVPEVNAVLHCHPHEIETVRRYLNQQAPSPWKLQPDDTVAYQMLVLKTDEGDLRISWSSMLDSLVPP
ncbi:type III secretion system stator protein SctL [Pseudomonas sp. P7759]|uniref:type III secretion system stator protein SctL n=1 Tax=Pseudomonas sp. P7759 TaxID=2738831 RepID=UPI00159FDC4B|nr:type III secretion system stator protein SctL [Pseudomonas sp. P7759]NWC74184.1 type III secretion system stator protein SctL [Pseudomonas sp. P7759]